MSSGRTVKFLRLACLGILLCGSLTGCGTLAALTYMTLAAVGVTGYAAYKVGEGTVEAGVAAGSAVGQRAEMRAEQAGSAAQSAREKVAGTVFAYRTLKIDYNATVEQVYAAAYASLDQMLFSPTAGRYDALSGELNGRTTEGKKISIRIKAKKDGIAQTKIRIGLRGDREASKILQDRISSNL